MALPPNYLSFSPPNPTAQTSTTGVMVGLGVNAPAFTPRLTGYALVRIEGTAAISGAAAGTATMFLNYGVAVPPPANNAAPAGISAACQPAVVSQGAIAGGASPFSVTCILQNLPLGSLVWFDLNAKSTTGSLTLTNINVLAHELGG